MPFWGGAGRACRPSTTRTWGRLGPLAANQWVRAITRTRRPGRRSSSSSSCAWKSAPSEKRGEPFPFPALQKVFLDVVGAALQADERRAPELYRLARAPALQDRPARSEELARQLEEQIYEAVLPHQRSVDRRASGIGRRRMSGAGRAR